MSQKDEFELYNENEAQDEKKNVETDGGVERYATPGANRMLCIVDLDGSEVFFNYAYLKKGKVLPAENTFELVFSDELVTLKGRNLKKLSEQLQFQIPKMIKVIDGRYDILTDKSDDSVLLDFSAKKI